MIANALSAAALSLLGVAGVAQTSATTSTQPITGGPVIAGVCVLSTDAVLSGSKVGQSASLRFQQLTSDAQHEIQAERTSLDTEAKTIESRAKSQTPAQLQQQRQALADKLRTLQAKADQRSRELEYTRTQVVQKISQQAQPLISTAYATHNCGLLFRRDNVLGGNLANDLTGEVTRGLDAKLTTLTFERETLPTTPSPTKPGA